MNWRGEIVKDSLPPSDISHWVPSNHHCSPSCFCCCRLETERKTCFVQWTYKKYTMCTVKYIRFTSKQWASSSSRLRTGDKKCLVTLHAGGYWSVVFSPPVELERRIDFELREGLVESRYWSAVTSHTAYWCSYDVALFLLTFMYRPQEPPEAAEDNPDPS